MKGPQSAKKVRYLVLMESSISKRSTTILKDACTKGLTTKSVITESAWTEGHLIHDQG